MKVLVVFEDQRIQEVVSFFLSGRFKIDVVEAPTTEDALKLLSTDAKALDAVVCQYPSPGQKVIELTSGRTAHIHTLCYAQQKPENSIELQKNPRTHFVSGASIVYGLEISVQGIFKELQTKSESFDLEFCKIKPHLLIGMRPLPGNLYVKLSEKKYVLIMREGFEFDRDDYDKFVGKKRIANLFLKRNKCRDFALLLQPLLLQNGIIRTSNDAASKKIQDDLETKKKRLEELKAKARMLAEAQAKQKALLAAQEAEVQAKKQAMLMAKAQEILERKKKADQLAAAQMAAKAAAIAKAKELEKQRAEMARQLEKDLGAELESVHEMSQRLGFTAEVQALTKKNVLTTIQTVRNTFKLSAVLMQLRREKDRYISSHSMLLAYVSCAIASQIDWSSDTTYQKLTLAAFLHDLALKNHELAAIQTLGELTDNRAKFTPDEIKAYKEHSTVGAELALKFSELPPDVDSIIAQHHERPDGSGFPRGLTHSRIGPLSTVFIIAHDLVSYLFKLESSGAITNEALTKFVQQNGKLYEIGNFKKVVAAIPKIKD
jgi:HD-GYP domain-containing protein (c-di-GMP phosphodiesterase class II)